MKTSSEVRVQSSEFREDVEHRVILSEAKDLKMRR